MEHTEPKKIRLRFAPSPTGYLHVGGLRTALYSRLYAFRHGGQFVLRIEDTDQSRLVPGAVEKLIRALDWAGVDIDEGPYVSDDGTVKERGEFGPYTQSERLPLYKKYADQLISDGHAYYCFCSSERLTEVRQSQTLMRQPEMYDKHCRNIDPAEAKKRVDAGESHVIRMKMPSEGKSRVNDLIRGVVEFDYALIDDQVLMKSDGFPTYHLAVVVDDHLMRITHVFRGDEWLPSTPKHIKLYEMFGWQAPEFAHLPLILNPDRTKLSKRQGDVAVEDYRDKGYLPEAMVNFVALLGWNPTADREIYSMKELGEMFDITKVNKGGAVFNMDKLNWINREYMKGYSVQELAKNVKPFMRADVSNELLEKAVTIERQRANTVKEIADSIDYLIDENVELEASMIPWKKSTPEEALERLTSIRSVIQELPNEVFDSTEKIEVPIKELITARGWGNGDTLWPTRVSLTGKQNSPSPFEVIWALGREKTISRLSAAIQLLSK